MPDPRGEDGEPRAHVDPVAFERLQQEVVHLRLQIEAEVRTRRLVVVDEAGIARARISTATGGECRMVLLNEDGFERIRLRGLRDIGFVEVAARSNSRYPTRVEMFAHDPVDGDECQVGVHLVDRGDGVGGLDVFEGGDAVVWTDLT